MTLSRRLVPVVVDVTSPAPCVASRAAKPPCAEGAKGQGASSRFLLLLFLGVVALARSERKRDGMKGVAPGGHGRLWVLLPLLLVLVLAGANVLADSSASAEPHGEVQGQLVDRCRMCCSLVLNRLSSPPRPAAVCPVGTLTNTNYSSQLQVPPLSPLR